MAYGVYALLAVVSVVASLQAWRTTRAMANARLKTVLRVLPISVCWSFAPCGSAGFWWPAPCAVLFGFSMEQRLVGLGMMAAATLALYAVCSLARLAGRLTSD